MEVQGLGFLPILWAAWTFLGFITLYVFTILNGHAESYLIYISETGDYFPESVLFMVMLAVSAVLDAFLSYCMYRYYAIKCSGMQHCYPHLQNTILGIGWIACVGTVIAALLPAVAYPWPHRIAAVVSFLGSAVRNTCQAILVHNLSFNSQRMCHLRMSISILTVLSLIILFFSRLIWWQICSGSLCLHLTESIAIITEWIGAIGLLVYKLTHYADFQHLVVKGHCGLRENWLFLRDTKQETWNSHYPDWWDARHRFLMEHLVQPLLFYIKHFQHFSKKDNIKLVHQSYSTAVPPSALITHMRPSSLGFVEPESFIKQSYIIINKESGYN